MKCALKSVVGQTGQSALRLYDTVIIYDRIQLYTPYNVKKTKTRN